jgi:hypothetical protein
MQIPKNLLTEQAFPPLLFPLLGQTSLGFLPLAFTIGFFTLLRSGISSSSANWPFTCPAAAVAGSSS